MVSSIICQVVIPQCYLDNYINVRAGLLPGMQNLPQDDQSNTPASPPAGLKSVVSPPAAGVSKETEPLPAGEAPQLEEIVAEVELEPEVEAAGVEKKSERVTLPPDVKKMGVTPVGPSQKVVATSTSVKLPLTDDQVTTGLHAQIISSIRWLAEWCVRQLKKAHFHLRVIAGHTIREPDGDK